MFVTFITPAAWLRRLKVYQYGAQVYGTPDSITGPLILAGIVKRAGHHVEAYEELNGSFDYDRLLEKTDVLCLYTMTSNAPRAYELADLFHEKGHARVLIGGMHASAVPEEALAHADQVMVGEGENTILDVVEGRLTDPIVKCRPVCDLDSVPWPDYSVLKTPVKAANIMTSRGCPYRCSFCTTSRMFAPYRRRSVDSVIAEIKHYHRMGFEYMNFEDDNFTADKERAKEICRRIIDENLQFKETFFFGRTDMANDPELLDLLAKAHLNWVLIGIESLNQESLDTIDKHQSVEDIRRAGEACREHGIQLIASIVLGIDTDTHEDIMRAVQFAKDIDASKLQPAVLTPFPGTPVYEQYEREGRMLNEKEEDWEVFDMMNATFQPKHMSPWDLEMTFFDAANKFYDRKSAFRMGKLFGWRFGVTRYVLGILARLGRAATWEAGVLAPSSWYGKLRNAKWMFGDEKDERKRQRQVLGDDWMRAFQATVALMLPVLVAVGAHGRNSK
ncbi:MAG: B12-binding domain-containing radical SAM protein [Tractidigestivibacter sp.]|jgi:radical SAM superfamily enzyme YgiQ (UPF0313 family)|uniref:B12-binding domain-containing radical SAM protein n=1 Tax=Tractidigestivibacter sp. TaxID=2847320 RepID=UPI003D9330A7